MQIHEIILGAILIVVSIVIVVIVLLQQSREAGLSGVIAGGAETFFGKNKGRTVEAKLSKWTKVFAIAFFVFTLIVGLVIAFTH